jgi:hypothetical protein
MFRSGGKCGAMMTVVGGASRMNHSYSANMDRRSSDKAGVRHVVEVIGAQSDCP